VHLLADDQQAIDFLQQELHTNDLVLVKGSRAVGMDQIVSHLVNGAENMQGAHLRAF
jgi:UDP-N-acetylmuramyl pentapeptide synthase